mgnify:CR=1 FL=1
MVKVKEIKTNMDAEIYPEEDYLDDYMHSDFASFISIIQVEAIVGKNIRRIGDTGITIELTDTGNTGEEGLNELKQVAREMIRISQKAIPLMSKKYAEFYNFYVNDFEKNGLVMPAYGKIL